MSLRERQHRRSRSRGGPVRILLLAFGLVATVVIIGLLSAVGWVVSVASSAPDLSTLKARDAGQNSVIYAADDTRLGVIQSDVLRQPVPAGSIPQMMRDATVAIEDKRFYQHKGVDFEGIVRAAMKNLQSDQTVQGGSTLTMQLIRNLYTPEDRARNGVAGYKRKIREAKLAEELENVHTGRQGKEWILDKYLNNVPYGTVGGQNAIGVQAAARVFFNKRAHDLTLPEAAMLAGLPQAPTSYNPYLNEGRALRRRDEVLKQMLALRSITPEQYQQASTAPAGLHRSQYYRERRENYFFDYVRKELVRKFGRKKVGQGGLKVYTTIDLRFQRLARAAIAKNLDQPDSPSSAVVSIDPKTGYIRAMASSSNYGDSKFNLATQGKRQPGSTFKMIVLMTALRRGVDINRTSYVSKKLNFIDPVSKAKIDVSTAEGNESNRPKSLFQAVVSSDNTVFQQLDLDLGPPAVTQTAKDMGVTSKLHSYPSEALGSASVSPLEMTRAYVTINDGGERLNPIAVTKVVFPGNKVDTSIGKTQREKVFTDGQTNQAIQAMKANIAMGTGTRAKLQGCTAAGKTGTTDSFTDAWFDGMTRGLNTAVWVGYPGTTRSMTNTPWAGGSGEMFGGNAPAQIWKDFMTAAVDKKNCGDWPKPSQPFVARPFKGRYTSGGYTGSSPFDPNAPAPVPPSGAGAGGTQNGQGTGNGGQPYPPQQYESPPQTTPVPPIPPPTPPTGGGNGNGNGNNGAGSVPPTPGGQGAPPGGAPAGP